MKYLVMECHEDYAVLLDESAGFCKAVNAGYLVGSTIENPQLLKASVSHKHIMMKVSAGLAAAAACLTIGFGAGHYMEYVRPYSSIRLSINPDVEMQLNHHGQVLTVKGLNEDGQTLVEGYHPRRQNSAVVADELIDRAIEMGFLSDGTTIVFEIDTPDADLFNQYGIELRSEAIAHTQGLSGVEIVVLEQGEILETQPDTYDEIVIPIPTRPTEETIPEETKTPNSPTPSVTPDSSEEDARDDDTASSLTPITTVPPATVPPVTNIPAGDSGYDDNTDDGDSGYDDNTDDGDSGYDTDD